VGRPAGGHTYTQGSMKRALAVGLCLAGSASAFTAPAIANIRKLPLAQSARRAGRGPACAPARRAAVPSMMLDPASVGREVASVHERRARAARPTAASHHSPQLRAACTHRLSTAVLGVCFGSPTSAEQVHAAASLLDPAHLAAISPVRA
jgi:hypothetical protein